MLKGRYLREYTTKRLVLIFLIFILPETAIGEFFDGNRLYNGIRACTNIRNGNVYSNEDTMKALGNCAEAMSYMKAVVDMHDLYKTLGGVLN
jgi:hypothetical protein